MNAADWHLMITHAPLVGGLFGLGLLLLGLIKKSEDIRRAALLAFVVASLCALPAYLTGSPAFKLLRLFQPTMSPDAADQHMEIAMVALAGSVILGLFSVAALLLFRKGKPLAWWVIAIAILLSLISSTLLAWTANLGGKVRHTEIRRSL